MPQHVHDASYLSIVASQLLRIGSFDPCRLLDGLLPTCHPIHLLGSGLS